MYTLGDGDAPSICMTGWCWFLFLFWAGKIVVWLAPRWAWLVGSVAMYSLPACWLRSPRG